MRTFDLEKAKAGHPLVTRDGKPAKFIAHVPEAPDTSKIVALILDGRSCSWHQLNGVCDSGQFSSSDLFLADPPKVKKSGWIAHGNHPNIGGRCAGHVKSTKEEASQSLRNFSSNVTDVQYSQIEWEEPAP